MGAGFGVILMPIVCYDNCMLDDFYALDIILAADLHYICISFDIYV